MAAHSIHKQFAIEDGTTGRATILYNTRSIFRAVSPVMNRGGITARPLEWAKIRHWQWTYTPVTRKFHLSYHIISAQVSATQALCSGVTFDSLLMKFRYLLLQLLEITAADVPHEIFKDIFRNHSFSFQFQPWETQNAHWIVSLFHMFLIGLNAFRTYRHAAYFDSLQELSLATSDTQRSLTDSYANRDRSKMWQCSSLIILQSTDGYSIMC